MAGMFLAPTQATANGRHFLNWPEAQFWQHPTREGYQRPLIHFAPRTVSQTSATSTVSTMTAANRAIESSFDR
jgi:hypothetical protein